MTPEQMRLERERDAAIATMDNLKSWALKSDDANDGLRAEIEQVNRERDEALSDRDAWARLCGAKDCYTPSSAKTYETLRESEGRLRTALEEIRDYQNALESFRAVQGIRDIAREALTSGKVSLDKRNPLA